MPSDSLTAAAGGKSLNGQVMRVEGVFSLCAEARIDGVLDLNGAQIGQFNDDPDCWPQRHGDLVLDRCLYGAFAGTGTPVDAASRIRWLSLQDEGRWGAEFWPQPWEECARVLREMGHGAAARAILIVKEKRQRRARRRAFRWFNPVRWWLALWDFVVAITIRYGRQPMWAFAWLAGFLLIGWCWFHEAEARGALKPNLPQIQRAPEWVLCGIDGAATAEPAGASEVAAGLRQPGETQYACFQRQDEGKSYPHFNSFIYSADTLIPVVGFEMQAYWLPDERDDFGKLARWYLWLHIAMGWALTLLAVAGFSGLIKQDSK